MRKYEICENVKIEEQKRELPKSVFMNALKVSAMTSPFASVSSAVVTAMPKVMSQDIVRIESDEELSEYVNCLADDWKKNCIYIEHPILKKHLIEARQYKDYIIREMMADIADYITDHIAVKKIVVGLMSKSTLEAKAEIPINTVVSDANISGSLSKDYHFVMSDVPQSIEEEKYHIWIRNYPDLVTAVNKMAGKLEIVQKIDVELDAGLGLKSVITGKLGMKATSSFEFYINYEKA